MELTYTEAYAAKRLADDALERLSTLGDLLMTAALNVTSIQDPEAIEQFHFLDSLSLLDVPVIRSAERLADLGSGAGLPALVLATALPALEVTAVESVQKKCDFIAQAASQMGLANVDVCCCRAEEHGRGVGRASYDVVVSRALASLPVVAEYSVPLLRVGGSMVAMKGEISNQECIQAEKALDILGAGRLESARLEPFTGAENRWVYVAGKVRETPDPYPRRPGVATKRPLGN
jgi:16S rRNA (guanine527-N7)-methyltransferase